jgi:RecA/RadA recombinase
MSLISKIAKNKKIKEFIYTEENTPKDFINTGCLSLNVLFSGKLDGGIPVGKVNQIAAPSSLGKSFIGMKVAKNAQKKGMEVIYLDTEYAYDPAFAENVGIDPENIMVVQDNHIESIQSTVMNIHAELEPEERKKILLIIDSWGGLVTSKTVDDATTGKDVSDMTISKKKNSFARLLTGMGMTVFVINQVYDSMNQYDPLAISGGRGIYFASSSIVLGSSKAKNKESSGDITGAIVTANTKKSRFAKENSKLKYLINYDGGISAFYGILDNALEGGYIDKPSMGWYSRPCVPEDKKWREKDIYTREFWAPVISSTDFKEYIEKKYTFEHSEISDEDFEWDEIENAD